ncbi:hypothetical protein PSTT_06546 [Puccinia striiformis]|uniref:SAM domain-containing protein n=1 Tax=Puccinia striiformis TaxID=27350 RepID=A0A2S4VJV2_9BASI|nr:hypothetical protein PSTT_06546 [Puccinia striiformis]
MHPSRENSQPMSSSSSSSHQADSYIPRTSLNLLNTVTPVPDWTEEDVKGWLQAVGFDELAHVTEEQGIDGTVLMHLDSESLKDLGFVKVGQRLRLMRLINELMGIAENFDLPDSNPQMMGRQMNPECDLWSCFHNHSDRIRILEDQVCNLNDTTKFLRERTDSLSSFNTSWAMQSCPTSLAPQSSKPSADSGNSTPPTTASSIRTAITCPTSNQHRAQDTASNESDSAVDHHAPPQFHDVTEHLVGGMDRFTLASPTKRIKKHTLRVLSSPRNAADDSYTDSSSCSSSSKTPQPGASPQNLTFSPKTQSPKKPYALKASRGSQQSFHGLADLHRKFSGSKTDEPASQFTPPATGNIIVQTSSRKPSLVARRVGVQAQGIGSRSMRSGGALHENRTGGVWKRSSSTTMLSNFPDELTQIQSLSSSRPEPHTLSPTSINRSASTSNLKAANSSDPRLNHLLKRVNTETSMRVKSNTEQTVIEDQRHQGTLPQLRRHPFKSLSLFQISGGIDFAIRSIDEIPSPLRLTGNSRKKNLSFNLEEELLTPDDSQVGADGEIKKIEPESKPLAYGLAICGYQAETPGELTVKAGESFKLRSHCKGRYYLERESNVLLASPLSATNMTPSPSPTRFVNELASENVGWVPKAVSSKPLDGAAECFDLENMTTPKVTLVSFQSQPTTWSGELNNVLQGEKIRVFNHKTRFHWVYYLSMSATYSKLQKYLLQQSSSRLPSGGLKSGELSSELNPNRKPLMLVRSASTATPQKYGNSNAGGSPTSLRTIRTQRRPPLQSVQRGHLDRSIPEAIDHKEQA